jgi:hypothetical protein
MTWTLEKLLVELDNAIEHRQQKQDMKLTSYHEDGELESFKEVKRRVTQMIEMNEQEVKA